jgi:hypothetical protein
MDTQRLPDGSGGGGGSHRTVALTLLHLLPPKGVLAAGVSSWDTARRAPPCQAAVA